MEDVRSSEVLEKEVLEDARKKAERILKNAEKQTANLRAEWNLKKEAELALLNEEFEKKKTLQKQDQEAAFPLEIQRRKLKFLAGVFENFLSSFFENLSQDDFAQVLGNRGKKALPFLTGEDAKGNIEISYAGISAETARSVAASLMGADAPAPKEGRGFRGLIFSCPGKGYRYRLTADELIDELREYHRQPILDALWKERKVIHDRRQDR
jgi:V/A-type H+-transporting ATPase subunit E